MFNTHKDQGTISNLVYQDTYLLVWVESFLIDRKAQNFTKGTLDFYRKKLKLFTGFCDTQFIKEITEITPDVIRRYLLYLEETGHNPGGVHACYRALRAFLNWWENEYEPDDWKNPIKKVKAPKVGQEPLAPVETTTIRAMLNVCDKVSFTGARDRAILLSLLDTGARASEFLAVNLIDFNFVTGEILIRRGKGRKPRTVFFGKKSRRAVRRYLRMRNDSSPALWITDEGERLHYDGLRQILRRRAEKAGVNPPSCHSFRRAFALTILRSGTDIFTLAKMMGHSSIQCLQPYLKQSKHDIETAHRRASPADDV